ncbi:MAG: hypothetical protein QOJ74_997, partial [Ilumatobacteraceae bacterium]|nr:hypothetical protein [Ilumatobacteraceae bacterium]
MKAGPAPEIIEIIDDDADLGGPGQAAAPHLAPNTSRRWVGPVAATTLLAIIGYGVISTAISNGASTARHPATTLPRRTAGSPTPTINLIAPQFYVADPVPDGFSMHFAETLGMGGNPADFTDSTTAQLWATADATANTGSWFVVSRGTHHSTGRNAYRTVVGAIDVVVEKDPSSGQSRLSFTKDGDSLEITAFGWADRQLVRLVDSVFVRDSQIQFHNAFFATDHKQLLDADPPTVLYGLPVAWVGYTTGVPASAAESFTITVAGFSPANRDVAIRFALVGSMPFTIGDLPGVIGQSAADPRLTILQWRDGDRLITIRGNIDQATMVTIAYHVHAAPDEAVTNQVRADQPVASVLAGERHTVGSGWLDGPWDVRVSANPAEPTDPYVWWIAQPSTTGTPTESRLSLSEAPSIETLVEHDRTYVL